MKNHTKADSGLSTPWLVVLGLLTLALVWQLDVSQKWSGAIGLTVIVFVVALTQVRHLWRNVWFWVMVLALLMCHLAVLHFMLDIYLRQSNSVPRMYWILVGVPEGVLIVVFLEYLNRVVNKSSPGAD